jgi:hypothetical protein
MVLNKTHPIDYSLQSDVINFLRFPLVIFVVFIHYTPDEPVNMQNINYAMLSGMDVYNIIHVCWSHVIAHICNPLFFMFSGYLFFLNVTEWNWTIYLKKIKKRIRTLFIPYILWNIIRVAISVLVSIAGKIIKRDGDWGRIDTYFNMILNRGIGNIFWNYHTGVNSNNLLGIELPTGTPFSVPTWFLRDLIVISVFAPVVFFVCKYLKIYGLIVLGLVYCLLSPVRELIALFFFCFGAYFSIHSKNMAAEFRRFKVLGGIGGKCIILLACITMILCTYFDGTRIKFWFFPIYNITSVISAVIIVSYLFEHAKIKVIPLLAKSTFIVYVAHGGAIMITAGMIFDFILKSPQWYILLLRYITVPLLTVAVCVCVFCVLNRFTPKLLGILTGGRE